MRGNAGPARTAERPVFGKSRKSDFGGATGPLPQPASHRLYAVGGGGGEWAGAALGRKRHFLRSEETTYDFPSLIRTSFAAFCWKNKTRSEQLYTSHAQNVDNT